jgi:hypothetical protein
MISILEKLGSYQSTTSSFFFVQNFTLFAKFWNFSVVKFNFFVDFFSN